MALTDENSGMVMPVQPMGGYNYGIPYGGNFGGGMFGNGNDWLGLLFLIALCNGGWGGFGGFGGWGGMMGMGMMGMDFLYPWLNNSEHISDGFRDQQLSNQVGNIQNAVTSGFGDVQTALCGGFAGVNASINGAQNALAQQMYTNQISDLERSYAAQTATAQGMNAIQGQLAQCCCDNRLATCQTQNIVQNEGNATRFADANNTRDIIESQTRSTQAILDKLCALELDGVKSQLAQAQRENIGLQNAVNMATMQASQTAQTAQILAGQNNEIDALYNRLKNCPVNTVPVYGNQPIFTCSQNTGCGCGSF
jgi:hypothetical protein